LEINEYVSPLKLPKLGSGEPFGQANNTGYGSNGTTYKDTLQLVEVSIFDKTECEHLYQGINPVTQSMICAVGENGEGKNKLT